MMTRARTRYRAALSHAWDLAYAADPRAKAFLALYGESGVGKRATVESWLAGRQAPEDLFFTHGGKLSHGYFAGLYELYRNVLSDAESAYPHLIHRHEESLKRLFPYLPCTSYRKEKDLTNLASPEERTRFYHHEYAEKLLHGVYEFLLDYFRTAERQVVVIIDEADQLPPTIKTFLEIYARRSELADYLRLILLCDQPLDVWLEPHAQILPFARMEMAEVPEWLADQGYQERLTPRQVEELWRIGNGNPAKMVALLECWAVDLSITSYLTFDTLIDFYLSLKGENFNDQLVSDYVAGHNTDDDPIVRRAYSHAPAARRDTLHRREIQRMQQAGDLAGQTLHLIHYVSLSDKVEQLCALTQAAVRWQEIGVYDSWLDLVSHYYTDPELRALPDGDQPSNGIFVRMAFILYSLGLARMSIPYLELFYESFPESKMIPMILYSQSMTYGRYQVPVDLAKAEKYALLNLGSIDTIFRDHPKHVYIKVFAENALAYIRARQGRFDEAIQLCTAGLEQMVDIYGDRKYALHQSILVYNTGQVYELIGDFEQAYETYSKAIALDPQYGEYYNDRANLLQKHGRYAEALADYAAAFERCPPYYEAHINRAGVYEHLGEYQNAEADYQRALVLKPDAVNAHVGLADLCYQQGRHDEALKWLDKAIFHTPTDSQAYNNRGLVNQELGRLAAARADFDQALRHNPKLAEAYNNRAILRTEAGDQDGALSDLTQALALRVELEYLVNRGIVYQKQGQPAPALQEFAQAVERFGSTDLLEQLMRETRAMLAL